MTQTKYREEELRAAMEAMRTDLPGFASALLRVRTKAGRDAPLRFNRAQRFLHERLEEQLRRQHRVRALVLKGRQQGVSTYMQARFFWRIWFGTGQQALILTHRQDATQHLFDMTRRFVDRLPEGFELSAKTANEDALFFDKLDSGYKVATAGARATGRSATAQLIHGSEVGYWPSAEDHMAGLAQAAPDLPGTEIVLESTANGVGNLFHRLWQTAERGESDYIAVFIPWHWQEEYARPIPPGFKLTEDEIEYQRLHGLSLEQLAWRQAKIRDDFGEDSIRFQVEYPSTAAEAFAVSRHDAFIPPELMAKAQVAGVQGRGALLVGVDPARFGAAATAIVHRRGREVLRVERLYKADTMQVAGRIVNLIRNDRPGRVFIDAGGLGAGIYDRLTEMKYGDVVIPVQFGERALRFDRYVNRRAEIWDCVKEWLRIGGVSLGRDESLPGELNGPGYSYDSQGRLKLESKEEMRSRGIASPDAADALALTFACPMPEQPDFQPKSRMEIMWERMDEVFEQAGRPGGREYREVLPGIHTG
jgi:hypothetical protein